jgi:hypothetical protein
MRNDHLRRRIDRGLAVISLNKAIPARHDPTVRIGEIALRLGLRRARRMLGLAARPRSSAAIVIIILRLGFGLGLRLGFCFERGLGLADLGQALLFVGNPVGQLVAALVGAQARVILAVGSLSSLQPVRYFGCQSGLGLLHPRIAHRLVLGRIGFDLRTIQRDMAELDQTSLGAQLQHLHKQTRQRFQMPPAKF